MSNYLIDINNISNFNYDNIIIGTKIQTTNSNSKYYIYYHEKGCSPKDIYIRLPKVRLIYNLSNSKYTQLSIPLYPLWDELNLIIKFIKKLENNIISKLNDIETYSNIINKKNGMNFLKTNYNENSIKITSNMIGTKTLLSDFKINGEIEMIIKLDYIWVKSKKCGLSINLYQIKYYPPASQIDFDFIDEPIIKPTEPIINNISAPPPPAPPVPSANNKVIYNRLSISDKELKKAIKKLKSIST
jgi:hypothetical protein